MSRNTVQCLGDLKLTSVCVCILIINVGSFFNRLDLAGCGTCSGNTVDLIGNVDVEALDSMESFFYCIFLINIKVIDGCGVDLVSVRIR